MKWATFNVNSTIKLYKNKFKPVSSKIIANRAKRC